MSAPSELTERFRFLELDVKAAFSDAGTQLETFESGAVWLDVHLEGRLFVLHYLDEGFATHYRLGSAGLAEARVQLFGLLGAAQTGPLV